MAFKIAGRVKPKLEGRPLFLVGEGGRRAPGAGGSQTTCTGETSPQATASQMKGLATTAHDDQTTTALGRGTDVKQVPTSFKSVLSPPAASAVAARPPAANHPPERGKRKGNWPPGRARACAPAAETRRAGHFKAKGGGRQKKKKENQTGKRGREGVGWSQDDGPMDAGGDVEGCGKRTEAVRCRWRVRKARRRVIHAGRHSQGAKMRKGSRAKCQHDTQQVELCR